MTRDDCLPDKRSIILYVSQFLKFISSSPTFKTNKKQQKCITKTEIFINNDQNNNFSEQEDNCYKIEFDFLKPFINWINATLNDPKLKLLSEIEEEKTNKLDEYQVNIKKTFNLIIKFIFFSILF